MLPWPENCVANVFASSSIACSTSQLTYAALAPLGFPTRSTFGLV